MSKRIIQTTPSGEWGIPGVDLASLSPRVYGALCKLKDMEALLEVINSPTAQAWERDRHRAVDPYGQVTSRRRTEENESTYGI